MSNGPMPAKCPSCGGALRVVRLECGSCGAGIDGGFSLCPVCRLDGELRRLFELFLQARGNLKEMQRSLGLSYPTVRQRVEALFAQVLAGPPPPDPMRVLERLRRGEISVEAAEWLLRGEKADPASED